jgi:hypothetical protein
MQYHDFPKQNPFSLYDIIGYFIPGSIFLFLFLLFDVELEKSAPNTNSSISVLKDIFSFIENLCKNCESSVFLSIISFLVFFSISYVIGHIISILSNIIIEKSIYCQHHNYLSYIILNKENLDKIPNNNPPCLSTLLLFYIGFYDLIFEGLNYNDLNHNNSLDCIRKNIICNAIAKILKDFYQFDGEKICDIDKYEDFEPHKKPEDNFFEPIYHYVLERATHHAYKIQNYVALYGFMRNISMVFCLLFWITIIGVISHLLQIITLKYYELNLVFLIIFSFLSFITLVGLHKYKKRYTLEVLQAGAALYYRSLENKNPTENKTNQR